MSFNLEEFKENSGEHLKKWAHIEPRDKAINTKL